MLFKDRIKNTFLRSTIFFLIVGLLMFPFLNSGRERFILGCFMLTLFSIDLYRRTKWVKDVFVSIEEQSDVIVLKYYTKDKKIETFIKKTKLDVKESHTLDKYPKSILTILNDGVEVAKFYSSPSFDNKELEELYRKVMQIKANA